MSTESIVLASASPRRRELLVAMGVRFEVITADVREHDAESAPHLSPAKLAEENARQKAAAVASKIANRWVLGADTIVTCDGKIYGKPASLEQAREFLRDLSGHVHQVITGCALIGPDGNAEIFHDMTRVTFRALSDDIINRYLAEVSVLDKAGAYALQEHGEWIVKRVEGSHTNVIGLPTEVLENSLLRLGLL